MLDARLRTRSVENLFIVGSTVGVLSRFRDRARFA
jgi:hypothetical protein